MRMTRLAPLLCLTACAGAQQPPLVAPKASARKALAMAVPAEALVAIIADKPWSRSELHRQLAARLGLARQYAQAMVGFSGMAGFDLSDPLEWAAHGFEPESGLAWFTLPGSEVPIATVGIADTERAESALRRFLERYGGISGEAKFDLATRATSSGERMTIGTRAGADRIGFLTHGGFLYFRSAGPGDPAPALQRIAALGPDQGLGATRDFIDCARRSGSGDLLAYLSREATIRQPGGRGADTFAVGLLADRVQLKFAGPAMLPPGEAQAFAPREPRTDLAADAPADALAWFRISAAPAVLWRALVGVGAAGFQQLRDLAVSDPDDALLSNFTGNFALGIHGGARGPVVLLSAELERDRSGLVEAALDRAAERLAKRTSASVQRRTADGAPVWRLANGSAIVAIARDKLFVALSNGAGGEERAAGPPRWPGKATPFDLGPLEPVLVPKAGRRSVRDELGSATAAPRPASRIAVDGAVLDPPGLLRLLLSQTQSGETPAFESAAAFVSAHSGLLSRLRVSWLESPAGLEGGLSLELSAAKAAAANLDPLIEQLRQARQRVAEHDGDAGAHLDLAELLLQAGAGEAARDEARRGVSLAPGAASPLIRLGHVLEHDALGRRWHPGFDPQSAEAAFRKARALDPAAGLDLALLLVRDALGELASSRSRLPEAIAEIQALRAGGKIAKLGFLEAEFFAGEWGAVIADAKSVPQSDVRDAFALAAVAASQGQAAADSATQDVPESARRKVTTFAAEMLQDARLYEAAANLFWEASRGAPEGTTLATHARDLARRVRFEQSKQVPGTPDWTVLEALGNACDPGTPDETLSRALAADSSIAPLLARAALSPFSSGYRAQLLARGLGGDHCRDLVYSVGGTRSEGDREAGYRVQVWSEYQRRPDPWWLVEEQGALKIFCRGTCAPALAGRALSLMEAGKLDAAERVLAWVRASIAAERGDDDSMASLFISIYDGKPRRLQLAAAVTAALGNGSTRALPILAAALDAAQTPPEQARLRMALGFARLQAKDFAGAARVVEGVEQPDALSLRIAALRELHGDAQAAVDDWLRRTPAEPLALWQAIRQAGATHDLSRIEPAARKLISLRKYAVYAQNSLAWARFCNGVIDDEAIALARAASEGGDAGRLNTLASLYAEAGRMEEARKTLFQSIDGRANGAPGPGDRYVLGRIFEGYGLSDLAAGQYRRTLAELGKIARGDADCIAALARARLSALGRPAGD